MKWLESNAAKEVQEKFHNKKMFSSEKRCVGNKTSLASSLSGTSLTTTKSTAKPLPVAGAIFSPASRGTNELDIEQNIESGEHQNELFHLIDLRTATSEQLCMEQSSEASCTKMFRDFPNSLENTRICRKISEEGKRPDWLAKHRAKCARSKNFSSRFLSRCCGQAWCRFAAGKAGDWQEEATMLQCRASRRGRARTGCAALENRMKAAEFLQCFS